jgi:transcriptional regulator with XRE-family HTH domain
MDADQYEEFISVKLKEARLKLGMSQKEVSDKFGGNLTQATISLWEKGLRSPRSSHLLILCYEVFQVDPQFFLNADNRFEDFRLTGKTGSEIGKRSSNIPEDRFLILNNKIDYLTTILQKKEVDRSIPRNSEMRDDKKVKDLILLLKSCDDQELDAVISLLRNFKKNN